MNKQILTFPIADIFCGFQTSDRILFNKLQKECYLIKKNPKFTINIDAVINKLNVKIPSKLKKKLTESQFTIFVLTGLLENFVIKKNILFLHGSSFYFKKRGYIFLGQSGAGKTTLIKKIPHQYRLSDDTTIIKKQKSTFYIYPSTFDKKIINFNNSKKIILEKIFVLKQAKQNMIVNIDLDKKIKMLLENDYFIMNKEKILNVYKELRNKIKLYKLLFLLIKYNKIQELHFNKSFNPLKELV